MNDLYPFLTSPIPVTEHSWPDDVLPLVSISCPAFMHEQFIDNAIQGFLMQQTSFKIEILINDDASTDKTPGIIRMYEGKYPQLIKATYQSENQFSGGKTKNYVTQPEKKGKYIAFCEGDDFWCDPLKLQKQVDFLENNPDFVICHHNMKVIYEGTDKVPHHSNPNSQKEISTIEDLAWGNYIYTASVVCRNKLFDRFPNWMSNCPVGDYPLHMLNAQFGKIRYFKEIMGVYRIHPLGVWQNKSREYRIERWVEMLEIMKSRFSPSVNEILKQSQNHHILQLLALIHNDIENTRKYSMLLLENNPKILGELYQNSTFDSICGVFDDDFPEKCNEPPDLNKKIYALVTQISQRNDQIRILQEKIGELSEKLEVYEKELKMLVEGKDYIQRMPRSEEAVRSESDELRLINLSGLFDADYYVNQNPDVMQAGIDPLIHYLRYGWKEGRNPSRFFNTVMYLKKYMNLPLFAQNPLVDFILRSKNETEP